MQCQQCGVETEPQARFCHRCGHPLLEEESSSGDAPAGRPGAQAAAPPRERLLQAAAARQQADVRTEEELWQGSYSSKAMIGAWIAAGVVTLLVLIGGLVLQADTLVWGIIGIALLILWAALGLRYAIRRGSVHYRLTSQRFMHEAGLLWRRTDRIELIDVDDVTFTQGPVERMFDVGTITIRSSDSSHPELKLPGIQNVRQVAQIIDDSRRQERMRRGLHIEAV